MKFVKFFSVLLSVFALIAVSAFSACASDIVRVGVVRFDIRANGVSRQQADAITDEFARMLANSRSIAVIERERLDSIGQEHRLNMSGLIDSRTAVEIGRFAGLQYIITGAVTQFATSSSAQAFLGIAAEAKEEAKVTIDMRVIDVQTGEIVLALAETGSATHNSSSFVLGSLASSGNKDSGHIQEAAISDAVSKLGNRLKEAVAGEYSQVLSAGGRDIIISLGATSGVKAGNLYKVYAEGEEIRDMQGNVIGRRVSPVAVVRVAEVQNDFSVSHVIDKGGNPSLIRRGDKIEPISSSDAKKLAKDKAFITSRPRHSISVSELESETLDDKLSGINSNQTQTQTPPGKTEPVRSSSNFENNSTDPAKVIQSYGLSSGEANSLRIKHINANKMGNTQRAYQAFVNLANANSIDYLAAFKAGEIAQKLGDRESAESWYDKTLSINPNYEPARRARAGLSSSSSSSSSRSSSRKRRK